MIQTWTADVSALLKEDIYKKYYEQVPKSRKEKADCLKMQEDKALSVGAWILLGQMQETYHLEQDFLFNLSHSGEYVLCSVDDSGRKEEEGKLGCDLEKIKGPKNSIAKRFFCEAEYQKIQKSPEMFYRYWVLKESFLKATRMGMKLGMDTFEIEFTEGGKPYLVRQPEGFKEKYYLKEYEIDEIPYRIAVCSDSSEFFPEIKRRILE